MSEIRVRNDTGHDLVDVRLTRAGGQGDPVPLGPLPPGSVSGWVPVETVHRYPAIEASGPGTDLVHLPYAGSDQPALPEGRWTYVLRLEGGRLVVDLEGGAG
ncbi:hypothetical protein EXE59_09990 [Nocardioides eburneiflavus]|uniref:Uncharacterized protein n=1 Tax=Nocardioides eburneiflavus TaxID=2518372 RepID=A0A4Z1CJM9_9ACTN|nr:hypothetical protein [Nocardioides eburneiflavus]TGN64243.1 hypothetical protein EXE59_09990 [Nocardioides eburneiflavus]